MLEEKDLRLIEYDLKIDRLLKGIKQKSLVEFALKWLDIPELRPVDTTTVEEDYSNPQLTKQTIIERIKTHDWPNGLHAIQLAQLETKAFMTSTRNRQWKVGRLLKNKGKLRLDLEASKIQELTDKFLSQFFSCYLYTTHHRRSDLYWMRIQIYSSHEHSSFQTESSGFLIFYPQTEFVMINGRWNVTIENYIQEAMIEVFQADRLLTQKIKGDVVHYLTHVIKTRRSQGVFAQLRNNQVDSNPLDIRQRPPPGFEETYVNPGEQTKRIKLIDTEQSEARLKSVMENFGWDHHYGTTSLDINVNLPIRDEEDNPLTDDINFTIAMKGYNVPLGIKEMIKKGQIETPVPVWLETIGSTGFKQFYITKDGVSETEPTVEEPLMEEAGNENEEENQSAKENESENENENKEDSQSDREMEDEDMDLE